MGRRGSELEPTRWGSMVLLLMGVVFFCMVYIFMSTVMRPSSSPLSSADSKMGSLGGVPNLELWGAAVKWRTDFKFISSEQCCKACKAMCAFVIRGCSVGIRRLVVRNLVSLE
ncbi:hypothetical protein C2S52_014978 [Perilla frutescens var. hirtella]|nr:hypothetical protein C2S52_014978 [Perilla frutescens var. hirtella]KAH6816201.1 hypothetical protein C2S51_021021 [Perilla frutescens var. frutescens]